LIGIRVVQGGSGDDIIIGDEHLNWAAARATMSSTALEATMPRVGG
jgi:hypothetical protein